MKSPLKPTNSADRGCVADQPQRVELADAPALPSSLIFAKAKMHSSKNNMKEMAATPLRLEKNCERVPRVAPLEADATLGWRPEPLWGWGTRLFQTSFVALFIALFLIPLTAAEPMARPAKALSEPIPHVAPLTPQEALKSFKILDGFRMELLASEPHVASPAAMCYDEDGRAYVCEMRDYPYTDKNAHKAGQENPTDQPIGRVRLLEDLDGDGKFDRSTIFANDLSWPTGITPWKGGVFVAATPDIWYLKDTDGDGKADVRIKAFTGFRKLNVQATMNNLIWGLDNQIYGAGSSNGGQIRPGDKPTAKPVVIGRNDYRLDPVTGGFEAISGGARFGNTFDDWGNRFLCNIRNPAQHVVLPSHYLARNPSLPVRSPVNDIAPFGDALPVFRTSPVEPWRDIRAKRWSGERDINMPRSELIGAGVVTSSSGITVYRGSAYPAKYYGNLFVGEVAGNLFYRQVLTPDGVSFIATRPETNVEFLTSTDIWFRPVNFVNAPDGTLHVLDMYREVIEHPWSIPDDIREQLDLENGRDHGRIYRLSPPNFTAPKPPRLSKATTAELVSTLENPNSWWRESAQRLLFERRDPSATALLQTLVTQSRNELARLHALYLLASFDGLTEDLLARSLADSSSGVREHAVKLCEPWLAKSPRLRNGVIAKAQDDNIRVAFQTAFTLGQIKESDTAAALTSIAKRFAKDAWVRTAVLSSASQNCGALLATMVKDTTFAESENGTEMVRQLAQLVAAKNLTNDIARTLLEMPDHAAVQATVLLGFGDGIKRSGRTVRKLAAADASAAKRIDGALLAAQQTALDAGAPPARRQISIQLLAHDDFDRIKATVIALLDPRQPQEIQRATVTALTGMAHPEVASVLLAPWRTYTPAIRSEAIQAMLGVKNRLLPLFDAIEGGRISANQIPPLRRGLLLKHVDKEVQARAEKLFGENAQSSRKEVVAKYQSALGLKGDRASGKKVYEVACMTCHRTGDQGNDVGPNLATVRQWNPEQLLLNILDPNREVAPSFVEYVVDLKDGQTISGLIADETASSITLKRADNFQQTILRTNIDKISGSGLSLMPEGLEANITPQQMADLLAFLLANDGR